VFLEEKFKCPRCGFEQAPADDCRKCGVNISKYVEIQKRRRAVPGGEKEQSPKEPPPEEETLPPDSQKPAEEKPAEPQTSPPKPDEPAAYGGLPGIGTLFDRSWEIFKRRIGTLIALYLLSAALFIVPIGIFIGIGYLFSEFFSASKTALMISGGLFGMIAGMIAASWGYAAFIFAVADDRLGVGDSLDRGGQKIWAFMWLLSILGYIIMGGFFLFFVPGMMFAVWFTFSQFILAREDKRGMDALLKSREYVRGYFWDIFLRLFIIWLVSAGIGAIPFIGSILSIILMPFVMIFIFLVYEDIKTVKGDISYSSSAGEKFKWIAISSLGYIVLPILIIALMGASLLYLFQEVLKQYPY
jgi:hypothetical protein